MRSRSARKVGRERFRYEADDAARIGTETSTTAASAGERMTSTVSVTISSSTLPTTSTSTCRTNVVKDWTSAVNRETSTPARSLSKNGTESACRWS